MRGAPSRSEGVTIQMRMVIALRLASNNWADAGFGDPYKLFVDFQDSCEWKCHIRAQLRESHNDQVSFGKKKKIHCITIFHLIVFT